MASIKTLFRNVIRFEILSEEPLPKNISLKDIANETFDGSWSGRFLSNNVTDEELSGKQAVNAVKSQGTDPSFFQMDDEGNEIDY